MPVSASRPARARSVPRLLFATAGLSAAFWLAVLSGKLNLQSNIDVLPVLPGPALLLLLLLVVTLVLFLVACLIEEARVQADPETENTQGDF